MIGKPIEKISKDDILSLVDNAVRESRTLEYKQELPAGNDDAKKEFLADVSSFANASGGDILFGITGKRDGSGKQTGEPEAAVGISVANMDAEILRLESLIRDGIEPRLPGVRIQCVEGFSEGSVVVMRIVESWMLPHMVTLKGHSRFYSRNSAGKYPLDVSNIRSLFAQSEKRAGEIRLFRDARLGKIVANEIPIPLQNGLTCVVHLYPVSPIQCNIVQNKDWVWDHIQPLFTQWQGFRFNIDGLLAYGMNNNHPARKYVQVFRNGAVESLATDHLENGENKIIRAEKYENALVTAVAKYINAQHELGIDPPIVLMLSFVGAKGYTIKPMEFMRFDREMTERQIDRDLLILPDVLLDPSDGVPYDVALRPVFDALWQSAGWKGSMHYNVDGRHLSVTPT